MPILVEESPQSQENESISENSGETLKSQDIKSASNNSDESPKPEEVKKAISENSDEPPKSQEVNSTAEVSEEPSKSSEVKPVSENSDVSLKSEEIKPASENSDESLKPEEIKPASENSDELPKSQEIIKPKVKGRKRVFLSELQEILYIKGFVFPENKFDEVYPNILLGDKDGARNTEVLKKVGVTHILNAAGGTGSPTHFVLTGEKFYEDKNFPCKYLGLPMIDTDTYPIKDFFHIGADFIEDAITSGGIAFVHCRQGVSRSASMVIGYLMIKLNMCATDACRLVHKKRTILPNVGFLQQICELQSSLT